ncbi:MAG: hypothetical protein PHQ62_03275 [Clostridia bacterium]|nr:hypothetical protein [Clostridia bacterium]
MKKSAISDYGKRKYNMYSVLGIVGDILFYPIIFITLLCCFAIFADKNANKVPSILGVSMVSISSGSMVDAGFEIKDIVILIKKDPASLRTGDIIGFYNYKDSADAGKTTSTLTLLQSYDRVERISTEYDIEVYNSLKNEEKLTTRKSVDEVSANGSPYFHRIINIFVDEEGILFFQTQGESALNPSPDPNLICSDYVVGSYFYTPTWLRTVFEFVATPTGMISVVVVPLSILILFMLFSIIEQVSKIIIEKKVLTRLIRYNSEESINANIGIEMDPLDKIKFFATAEQEDKNGVADFLWGFLNKTGTIEKLHFDRIMEMVRLFEKDPKRYWMFWVSNFKNKKKKQKVEKIWREWHQEVIMKERFEKMKNKHLMKKGSENEV